MAIVYINCIVYVKGFIIIIRDHKVQNQYVYFKCIIIRERINIFTSKASSYGTESIYLLEMHHNKGQNQYIYFKGIIIRYRINMFT